MQRRSRWTLVQTLINHVIDFSLLFRWRRLRLIQRLAIYDAFELLYATPAYR